MHIDMVDMVLRPRSGHVQPRKPVSHIRALVYRNPNIARRRYVPGHLSDLIDTSSILVKPSKVAGFRVVLEPMLNDFLGEHNVMAG